MVNDRIIVNELEPNLMPIQHGDIVVFKDPGGWLDGQPTAAPENPVAGFFDWLLSVVGLTAPDSNDHLIKRVIGLPGDHVTCCNDFGQMTINGVPIDEPYLKLPAGVTKVSADDFDVTVPAGSLWVMGDNRYNSRDSRYNRDKPGNGFVPMSNVVGRAILITWPISRWTWLDNYPWCSRASRASRRHDEVPADSHADRDGDQRRMTVVDPTLRHERRLFREGAPLVIGCDEVGRGAIAGPVGVGSRGDRAALAADAAGPARLEDAERAAARAAVSRGRGVGRGRRGRAREQRRGRADRDHRGAGTRGVARPAAAGRSGRPGRGGDGAAGRLARLAHARARVGAADRDDPGEGRPRLRERRRGIRPGEGAPRPADDRGRRASCPATTGPATRATPAPATTTRSIASARPGCTAGAGCANPASVSDAGRPAPRPRTPTN